jgi:hypothetical protein
MYIPRLAIYIPRPEIYISRPAIEFCRKDNFFYLVVHWKMINLKKIVIYLKKLWFDYTPAAYNMSEKTPMIYDYYAFFTSLTSQRMYSSETLSISFLS